MPNPGSKGNPVLLDCPRLIDTGSSLMNSFSAVEQIQGLCRYTMEKLSGEDAKESPCEIK